MWVFNKYIRVIGLCAVLFLLAGLRVAWAQNTANNGIQIIGGKPCIPDQECKADSLTFKDSVLTGVTNRVWSFGDGTPSVTKKDSTVKHVYQTAGEYLVSVTRTMSGSTITSSRRVNIGTPPQPFVNWRTDTTICKGEVITLDPYAGGPAQSGLRFLWYPKGDTTQTLQVDSSGCYSVEAISPNGCTYQNRINVDVCGEKKESQGVKWYFGQNAGLDFSGGGSPKPITDGKLSTIEGSSSIADTKGKLLFYSDGIIIYDKDGKPMKSLVPGDTTTTQIPLGGNKNSTQSALIVPKPTCRGCEYLYYVYTTSEIRGQKTLTYSVVDMRKDGGKGAIVEKNIPVSNSSTEQSAAVENKRDSTFWVITRKYGTNQFDVRHLTRSENTDPITYPKPGENGGQVIDSLANAEGYIKIGPADTASVNGASRPMAVVIPGPPKNLIELYTFDDSLGTIKYNRTIDLGPSPPKAYGVEFSPDGQNLYVTMLADTNSDGSQKGSSYLLRYDLSQPDSLISRSKIVVDSSTTRQYGAVQIGPDGRIYVAIQGSQSLGTIDNPNGGLLDSLIYNPQGQTLGGQTSQLGLPNLVANFNDQSSGPSLMYGDTCVNAPTVFQIGPNCPKLKEAYTLDFGDGSRPYSTTATDPVTHPYKTPGQYFVSLRIITRTSAGGICKDTLIKDTLNILETPPDINLGADTAVCNKKGITLDLKVQAKVYVWLVNGRIASRQKTIKLERPGYYYVVGLAANGECFKSDTIEVQIKPPPTLDLGPDTVFCYRTSVDIRVPQQQYVQFQWSNGGSTRSISVSKAGTYTVTAQTAQLDGTTCENSDTIRVSELPKLRVAATLTQPLGCTSTDGAIELTPTPAGNYRYDWKTSDGTAVADTINRQTALTEGKYDINVTELLHSCKLDTSFTLKSPANTLAITPRVRDALCSMPNSGTISLDVTGGTAAIYRWLDQGKNTVATTPVFGNAAPGLYLVQIVDEKGCKISKDSIRVGLDSTGLARLGPDTLKCIGGLVVLAPLSGDTPGNTYQWSTGATSPSISVAQPGSYSLSVVNTQNGCKGRASIRVNDRPAPNFSYTQQASLCEGDLGTVRLSANGAAGLRFLWLTQNDTTKNVTVSKAGQYAVQVTDPQGCTATGLARVLNLCEPRVNMPDAFTPNSDGINDVLQIFTAYITDYEFRIYNRWGEVIFVSNSPEQKWDGTYKGSTYPSMLYPYVVQFRSESFPERGVITKRGSVLLLR